MSNGGRRSPSCPQSRDAAGHRRSESEEGLKHLAAIATEGLEHERGISGIALRLDGDEWTPWLPAADHPLRNAFTLLRAHSLAGDYAQQKALLDKRHERDGVDLFVASYEAVKDETTDEVRSYSTWSEGVDTLLPVTDQVILIASDDKGLPTKITAAADWDVVARHAGDLMQPADGYPERVRVAEFPTSDVLDRIGLADWAKG